MQWPLVAVAGPTGSGKSEAGLALAGRWPAEIINCDSLQVYRYLDIGTAKLKPEERRGIPHHLIDIVDPDADFSAGEYARRARPILRSIARSGRMPIVVGGTGFYLRALVDGLFEGPSRDPALRGRLVQRERWRPGFLHRLVNRLDHAAGARIHPNDTNKLLRAAEVCLLTRRPMSEAFAGGRNQLTGFRVLKLVLGPSRQELYGRVDRRAGAMFGAGLVAEVREVLDRGFPPDSKPFDSLGYRQALAVLQGRLSHAEAMESTRLETRRYAKRQWTWFRKEPQADWIDGFGTEESVQNRLTEMVANFLAGGFEDFFHHWGTIPEIHRI